MTPDTIHYLVYLAESNMIISASTNGRIYEWSVKRILACMKKNQKGSNTEDKAHKLPANEQYKYFMINSPVKHQSDLTCMDYMESL